MKVEHLQFEDGAEIQKELRRLKATKILGDWNTTIIGYNEVIATLELKRSRKDDMYINAQSLIFLIKRFDGKLYYALNGEYLSDIFCMNTSATIVGDIVNMGINRKTHDIRALDYRCVPLNKYCPTLPGIKAYFFESVNHNEGNQEFNLVVRDTLAGIYKGIKEYSHKDIQSDILSIKAGISKQEFINLQAKLNMVGVPYVTVDINTILALVNNKVLTIYTMQPAVLHWFMYDKEENKNYIRNYRIDDIPASQHNKYGIKKPSNRTREWEWY
jgi:hypothetical protein